MAYNRHFGYKFSHFGEDTKGHDLKAFGDTTGKYFIWDASANKFIIAGTLDLNGTSITSTGAQLNKAANCVVIVPLGTVNATTTFTVFVAPAAGTLNACKLVSTAACAASDTDYWTATLYDRGATGAGTDKIAEKTTKTTGGAAVVAKVPWDLGTMSATHKVMAGGEAVQLTLTKSSSATNLTEAAVYLEYTYTA